MTLIEAGLGTTGAIITKLTKVVHARRAASLLLIRVRRVAHNEEVRFHDTLALAPIFALVKRVSYLLIFRVASIPFMMGISKSMMISL